MELRGKRILVTGAGGFIGSHLVETLVRQGCEVRALVQYNSLGSWGWLDRCDDDVRGAFEASLGDIRDSYLVREVVKNCDVIFNLAALIAIPYSYMAPESYVDTNVKGALNVVQSARDHEVEKIVQVSTSEVYGTAQFVPITEEHPLRGQSPYAASKIGADHIAMSFYHSFGTPVTIARPFNTFGPRQSSRAVIPNIITQLASGRRRIKLGAIAPTRDFNYVKDTVAGLIKIAACDDTIGEVINIGSGQEFSIGETAQLIAEVMDTDIEIESDFERIRPDGSEVQRLLADNKKAKSLLDWSPQYSGVEGFRRALKETIDWFCKPEHLQDYKIDVYNK